METDDRLRQEVEGSAPRALKVGTAVRDSRDREDRKVTENRDLSDDDRVSMFRQTLFNDVLPDLPKIPGYHVVWLSTNHPNDTIARRVRLGYEAIKASDIPGMEYSSLKTGEYAGCIGINEMVAFKLPEKLHQRYMQIAHHDQPAEQDSAIVAQVDGYRQDAVKEGGDLIEGDGIAELRRSAPSRGKFSD